MEKNKGFTLIELLVSISILSILTIAFTTVSISAIKGNSKNSIDIVAMNIAQGEIENIRSQMKEYEKSSSISLTSVEGHKILENEVNEFSMISNNNTYNVSIEIKKAVIEGITYPELYEVKVKVKEEKEYFSGKSTELVTQIRLNKI